MSRIYTSGVDKDSASNNITGNGGSNTLTGLLGKMPIGGAGNDILTGGLERHHTGGAGRTTISMYCRMGNLRNFYVILDFTVGTSPPTTPHPPSASSPRVSFGAAGQFFIEEADREIKALERGQARWVRPPPPEAEGT